MSACATQDEKVRGRMAVCKELLLVKCSAASLVTLCLQHGYFNFQVRYPRCVVWNYKYKQYIVEHNSMILLRCISYIVSFNDMFRF